MSWRTKVPRWLGVGGTVILLSTPLAACGGAGSASDVTVLRLALNQTETHPSYAALQFFDQELRKATNERYRIDVFPNAVLGAQQEVLNLQSNGIVDLAVISGTQLENINADFKVFNLPRVFDSVEQQMKVIDDPAITGTLFKSLEGSNKITVIGGLTQGERSVYTKKAVRTPADMRGLKIRVQESPVMLDMIRAMGGNPTPMAFGEVYTGLQAGVIDGAENNEVSYWTQKHFEVAPFYSYTNHLVGLDYMVASTESLRKMSPEDRELFDQAWAATSAEFVRLWGESTQDAIDKATKAGATFVKVDDHAFDAVLAPVAEKALSNDVQRELYRKTKAVTVS